MKNPINLQDLTFIIPVRIDSIIRLENLLMVTDYISNNFDTQIIISESSYYNNGLLPKLLPANIHYQFTEDKDPIFFRTKYLNLMTIQVKTPFLAIWDADVIALPQNLNLCMKKLRSCKYEIAYPYDGTFLDVSELIRIRYYSTRSIDMLVKHCGKMKPLYGGIQKGGAILLNVEKYKEIGMENERFYGWAPEDWERATRWSNVGYKEFRTSGPLFHLTHPRDINGTYNSSLQRKITNNELTLIENCSRTEILERMKLQKKAYGL